MKVEVYSADWCPYCHALMDWLDSLGINYQELDIEKHRPDFDVSALPVTKIGDQKIVGFDRPAIKKVLKKAGAL